MAVPTQKDFANENAKRGDASIRKASEAKMRLIAYNQPRHIWAANVIWMLFGTWALLCGGCVIVISFKLSLFGERVIFLWPTKTDCASPREVDYLLLWYMLRLTATLDKVLLMWMKEKLSTTQNSRSGILEFGRQIENKCSYCNTVFRFNYESLHTEIAWKNTKWRKGFFDQGAVVGTCPR